MRQITEFLSARLSSCMEAVAGIALIAVMLLIGCDIAGRIFGYPVPGAYELVSLAGGLIIGLAVPGTSRAKAHLSVDLLLSRLPGRSRNILNAATRLVSIVLFLLVSVSMIWMGLRLRSSGEVTAVLALPFYPVVFLMGGAFLVQALVLFSEMIGIHCSAEAGHE
ncbi:MAG: TRAP transporter small permease [Acidobacteriota bacterium]|nr:TRAP transporter small permease [Acidobacteriota bacterium]